MKEATKKEVKSLIELNEITNPEDSRIEEIADRFPKEYTDEQAYVEFQEEIAAMVMEKKMKNKAETKATLTEKGYFFHPGGDLDGTMAMPKKRGIWKNVDSPIEAQWVGISWEEAKEDYERWTK